MDEKVGSFDELIYFSNRIKNEYMYICNLNYKKEKCVFIVVVFNVMVFLMEKFLLGLFFLGIFLCKVYFFMCSFMLGLFF